jgi:sugar phosphate isomerase/epimerase
MKEATMIAPSRSMMSRRTILQAIGAAGVLAPTAGCQTMQSEPFFARQNLPIGIQLYTLGELVRNDLDGTLKEVARIGYKTVELAGYLGKTPRDLRTAFDAAGVSCTSAHVGLAKGTEAEPKLLDDLSRVAADLNVIGATHVIAPIMAVPPDVQPREGGVRGLAGVAAAMTEDHWKRMAAQLNDIGGKLRASGLSFGYHNHNIEFVKPGARTGLEILIAETDPALVTFELDVGWAAAAGADPAQVFDQHRGRFTLMHVKDVKASTVANLELRMDPTEVGSGRLDWAKILPAAHRAGVRKFFVEQEPPFTQGRLQSAAMCYSFLSTLKA